MLPMMNLNADTTNVGKQISSIKAYINSLRDSIDTELWNISYEQLSEDLKKRIDNINDDIRLANEKADMVAGTIKANYITADVISAQYAKITELQATTARVGTLEADNVLVKGNITTINGNITSINGSIQTINGNISTMSGNISTNTGNISTLSGNITTINGNISTLNGTVSGLRGEFDVVKANYITANYVNATNILAALNSPTQGILDVGSIRASNFYLYNGQGYDNFKFVRATVGGQTGFFCYHS